MMSSLDDNQYQDINDDDKWRSLQNVPKFDQRHFTMDLKVTVMQA